MKYIITAAVAAFFMLFSMAAHAEPVYDYYTPTAVITQTPPSVLGNPFAPDGTGTVINFATDEDGKMFYIIETADGNVFYLVIDRQRGMDNVYFLTAVTAADLVSLAGLPPSAIPQTPTTTAPPNLGADSDADTTTAPDPAPQSTNNNMTMFIIIGVLALGGIGAGWYVKVYKPKQSGGDSEESDEYEPPLPTDDDAVGIRDWNEEDFDVVNEGVHPWYQEDESGGEE